jgi:hypothetical protein
VDIHSVAIACGMILDEVFLWWIIVYVICIVRLRCLLRLLFELRERKREGTSDEVDTSEPLFSRLANFRSQNASKCAIRRKRGREREIVGCDDIVLMIGLKLSFPYTA